MSKPDDEWSQVPAEMWNDVAPPGEQLMFPVKIMWPDSPDWPEQPEED